nr:leucine zipper putative tumor suppressor 2-like [Ipomoea batatas]
MPDQGSCSKLIEPCGVGSVTVPVARLHGSVVVLSGAPDNSGMLSASSSSRTVSDSALYSEAVVRSKPIHGWRVKRLLVEDLKSLILSFSKDEIFRVVDHKRVTNLQRVRSKEWPVFVTEHKRPKKSRALDDAAVKILAEEYEYEIFRSPEEYQEANLKPPRYDLPEKYTPQRAAVTVAVRPPLPEAGSRGTMRSFPVSARPPAPAKKISLGSKKAKPAKPTDPNAEALVPTELPLTTTHHPSLSGDQDATRAAKRGKEKETEVEEVAPAKRSRRRRNDPNAEALVIVNLFCRAYFADLGRLPRVLQMAHSVTDLFARAKDGDKIHRREVAPLKKSIAKREQRIKELEGKLRTAEETGRRILERADLGEKILTDPVLLARHICRGQETGEAVLVAISRTPIGEDLMYEFGTWAFNSGRKAMQNDVRTALEVAIDDADLPRILAILPEEVPDPGPTPFISVPEGRTLPVPVVEVSAGPSAEVAATVGPTAESAAAPSAGPSAEGDTEPGVEPPTKAN